MARQFETVEEKTVEFLYTLELGKKCYLPMPLYLLRKVIMARSLLYPRKEHPAQWASIERRKSVMRKNTIPKILFFAALSACWSIPSHAFVIGIDEFSIVRNGVGFFTDSFTDGAVPPSAPNFLAGGGGGAATYNVLGTISAGAEASGTLQLNTATGAVSANALEQARIETRVRLQTNIDPAILAAGLKSDDTLSLTGVFNATTPSGIFNPQYSIRFNDNSGAGAHQILQLQVRFNMTTNAPEVRFILQDFDANTIAVLGSAAFNPGLADEIVLNISRPSTLNNDFFGSFAYRTGGVDGAFTPLGVGQMFVGENFVRAEFNASDGFVPEPTSLALLALGLAGLGFSRRKQA